MTEPIQFNLKPDDLPTAWYNIMPDLAAVAQPLPPKELSRSVELIPFAHVALAGSFPSGHVARAAFLAGVAHVPAWLAVSLVALMMLTRVYLGEHWPSDVLGGLLLGVLVAQVAVVAERRFRRH